MFDLSYSHLRLFAKICETQSMSVAAKQLDMSLSAASRSLKKLQSTFDDPLFIRTYLGMSPTERSREILPMVMGLLREFERLQSRRTFDPSTLDNTITITAADNGIICILRPVIKKILEKAPGVNFRLKILGDDMLRNLADGETDFALYPTSAMPQLPDHYFSLSLFPVQRACMLDKNHPLAKRAAAGEEITVEDFYDYPKVVIELRQNAKDTVYQLDNPAFKEQRRIIELPYFLGAPYLIEGTDYTLMMPRSSAEFFAERNPHLVCIPYPGEAHPYHTRLLWHERNDKSPAMQWIRSLFVEYAGKIGKDEEEECEAK